MIRKTMRAGYVMLLTVLTVGVVSSASAIAILLLGLSIERNAYAIQLSSQAFAGAWSCAEHAIYNLRNDLEYSGDVDIPLSYGYNTGNSTPAYDDTVTCKLYTIGGTGNYDRTICTEATYGSFTIRRLEIVLSRVLPRTEVESWEEVIAVTNCTSS